MNKCLLTMFLVALALPIKAVEVVKGSYDGRDYLSFVVRKGDVQTQVASLLKRIYPASSIVFRTQVPGFLPADIEITGPDEAQVAIEMLAGVGLSACHYSNNIIEISKFRRKGICPDARMENGKYPELVRLGNGILTATTQWYGDFGADRMLAANHKGETSGALFYRSSEVELMSSQMDIGTGVHDSGYGEEGEASLDTVAVKEPGRVRFKMKKGLLAPQISELLVQFDSSPELVWELDDNTQWFNDSEIVRSNFEQVLADILESYDAFADVYLNDVVVVRSSEGF